MKHSDSVFLKLNSRCMNSSNEVLKTELASTLYAHKVHKLMLHICELNWKEYANNYNVVIILTHGLLVLPHPHSFEKMLSLPSPNNTVHQMLVKSCHSCGTVNTLHLLNSFWMLFSHINSFTNTLNIQQ